MTSHCVHKFGPGAPRVLLPRQVNPEELPGIFTRDINSLTKYLTLLQQANTVLAEWSKKLKDSDRKTYRRFSWPDLLQHSNAALFFSCFSKLPVKWHYRPHYNIRMSHVLQIYVEWNKLHIMITTITLYFSRILIYNNTLQWIPTDFCDSVWKTNLKQKMTELIFFKVISLCHQQLLKYTKLGRIFLVTKLKWLLTSASRCCKFCVGITH